MVSMSDSRHGGCEFEMGLRQYFFPAYFCLSSLQKHCEKSSSWFWKEICVSTGVRKLGSTCESLTAMIWP